MAAEKGHPRWRGANLCLAEIPKTGAGWSKVFSAVDHKVAGNSPVYSHGCKLAPSVAERVAGKPGLFLPGRKLYFRYSSQGGRPP